MNGLTPFEEAVVDALLAGDDPRLVTLRRQASACTVTGRRHTVVGSYTDLLVPEEVPRLSVPSVTLGDVDVEVAGVENGQATLLFVREGALTLLEFATYTGEWPVDPKAKRIGYYRYVPSSTSSYSLLPTAERDAETLALQLSGSGAAA
jgi:hypothetical protein